MLPYKRNPHTDCKSDLSPIPKVHPAQCNSVGMRPLTDRQSLTRVTTIHFVWSTIHAKCNYPGNRNYTQ